MATKSGPNNIDDGLLFHYDVANTKSFRGDESINYFNSINNSFNPLDLYTWGTFGSTSTWSRDYTQKSPVGGVVLKEISYGTDSYSQTYNNSSNNLTLARVGQTWTASVYVKTTIGANVQIWLFEANANGNYTNLSVNSFTAKGIWERITVTRTLTQSDTRFVQIRVATGTNGVTVYWDGIQLEKKPYVTPFISNDKPSTNSINLVNESLSNWLVDGSGQGTIGTKVNITDDYCKIVDVSSNTRQYLTINSLIQPNTTYTFSVKFRKISGEPTLRFQLQNYVNGNYDSTIAFPTTSELGLKDIDGWQIAVYTFTTNGSANGVRLWIQDGDDYVIYTHSFELKEPKLDVSSLYIEPLKIYRGVSTNDGGGLIDLSGNVNHASIINGSVYNTTNLGRLGFDGVNDYIRAKFKKSPIGSINIWFYTPSQITSGGMPIGYGGLGNYGTSGTIDQYDGFIFGDWTGGAANETIGYYQHNPPGFIYIREVISVGYHNIVINYNSTDYTYDFYLDGVKVTRYTASQGIVRLLYSDVAVIGCTGDPETVGTPYYGSPSISIVQVYNKNLTDSEIKQNYNANKTRFI